MDRPEPLMIASMPVGYCCPWCGGMVPLIARAVLIERKMPDPWDLHVGWHALNGDTPREFAPVPDVGLAQGCAGDCARVGGQRDSGALRATVALPRLRDHHP
jgi:hypothetical protein